MDAATLATLAGNHPDVDYDAMIDPYNSAMLTAVCNTVARCALWDSQILEESGGLRWMAELDTGEAYDITVNRELALELGNIYPGDGVKFKGAGPLQITGRGNFARVSAWAYRKGFVPTPTYFVDHPRQLRTIRYGLLAAVWYWTVARNMNAYADARDINGGSTAVNGANPANGLDVRTAIWNAALAKGAAILPTIPTPTHTDLENAMKIVIDDKTGRRFLINGVNRPKYLNAAQARVVTKFHNLPAATKVGHASLVAYDNAMRTTVHA